MTDEIKSTLGSVIRSGRWSVPDNLPVRLWWSSAELDFRDAKLPPGVTTIELGLTMASLEIVVPPGLPVDVQVVPFAGSVEHRPTRLLAPPTSAAPAPQESLYRDAPVENEPPSLRIVGKVRFASVEVVTRLPGETARDERRRERQIDRGWS